MNIFVARSLRGPCFFAFWGAWGRGMRIATGGVRTGFAMTGVLQGVRCKAGRADRGVRPYGCVAGSACKRGVGDAAPYGGVQGVREKNPPVTASPCQPPLGKGAMETGDADCHSQCAHWLRNDRELYMGCGTESAGGQRRPPLRRVTRSAVGRGDVVGSGPYGCATRGAGKMADL